jgi:hypothetical protein
VGHQQITPVNGGVYMVRVRQFALEPATSKDFVFARYTKWVMDVDDEDATFEYWSFFGTEITYDPDMVEVLAGPLI